MRTTYLATAEEALQQRKWYVVDAEGKTLGRLAAKIASVLRGKNKPTFTPGVDCGDFVVVINADKVELTGNKWKDKTYFRHTGYLGGVKLTPAWRMRETHPERMIEIAVKGMLPHNRLGRKLIRKLKVYAGPSHPHAAQKPEALEV